MWNTAPLRAGWTKTRELTHFLENKSAALKTVWRRIPDDREACMLGMKLCMYEQNFPEILIRELTYFKNKQSNKTPAML